MIYALAVAVSAGIGAFFLKLGSKDFSLRHPINLHLVIGFLLYVLATFFFVRGVRDMPLSVFYPLTSLLYVFASLLGFIFLKERVTLLKILGMACIMAGVVLLS